jgi:DNA-binding transcriptional LysR family regulator
MRREDFGDLSAFLAVAEERSFTRAAAKLGTSQSALSHTVRRLEERLGMRLLTRTTRSVSPTEAGERLAATLRPAFDDIDMRIAALSELREKPAGTLRISSSGHAAETILWPKLKQLMLDYPDVQVELSIDPQFVDIVGERFDAGVRLGERVEKDMIAMRIGPDLRMAIVGSPDYLSRHGKPKTPQDLVHHNCLNMRMATSGGLYVWELEKKGQSMNVRVNGQFACNDPSYNLDAALEGYGLTFVMENRVMPEIEQGRLVRVLEDWCDPFPGYHLFYPSRRQHSQAFSILLEALRYRA